MPLTSLANEAGLLANRVERLTQDWRRWPITVFTNALSARSPSPSEASSREGGGGTKASSYSGFVARLNFGVQMLPRRAAAARIRLTAAQGDVEQAQARPRRPSLLLPSGCLRYAGRGARGIWPVVSPAHISLMATDFGSVSVKTTNGIPMEERDKTRHRRTSEAIRTGALMSVERTVRGGCVKL